MQAQADEEAREWDTKNPGVAWTLTDPTDAVDAVAQVRKAIGVFARRALVDVKTGPGRRERGDDP